MNTKHTSLVAIFAVAIAVSGILFLAQQPASELSPARIASPTAASSFTTNLTIKNFNNSLIATVKDSSNNSAIEGASVRVYNGTAIINGTTNSSGKFEVTNLAAGTYVLGANKTADYNTSNASAAVTENATTAVTITLAPNVTASAPETPVEVPPVVNRPLPVPLPAPAAKIEIEGIYGKVPGSNIIKVYPGEKASFVISVRNTGNTPLTDVQLYLSGLSKNATTNIDTGKRTVSGPVVTGALLFQGKTQTTVIERTIIIAPTAIVAPQKIDEIPPGARKVFYVELHIPERTPSGNYSLLARTESKETTFVKPITLEILPAEEKPAAPVLIGNEILFLRENIRAIYEDAVYLEGRDADVTLTLNTLKLANESLDRAQEHIDSSNIESAKAEIETTRSFIRSSVEALAKVHVPYIDYFQTFIFIIIIAFVLLFTIIIYLKREQKKAYEYLKFLLSKMEKMNEANKNNQSS